MCNDTDSLLSKMSCSHQHNGTGLRYENVIQDNACNLGMATQLGIKVRGPKETYPAHREPLEKGNHFAVGGGRLIVDETRRFVALCRAAVHHLGHTEMPAASAAQMLQSATLVVVDRI